ncbi:hypothetical protein [Deinococcus aestuarii]|uniref:hypothetical protein n=1 Tax=Deinococcus aestuarii TaxID=2774531 RepID=UPI001C0BD993|nr:hypothetical protein [Deinococcus aestuarii]
MDLEGVLRDCTLGDDAALRVVVVWRSAGTGLRGRGDATDLILGLHAPHVRVGVSLPGAILALNVRLVTQVVLLHPGRDPGPFSPRLPGSVLWADEHLLTLEGGAPRFPVDVVDFASVMRLPENAAWYLDWQSEDLHAPAMGGLCLLVNASHPSVRHAVDGVGEPDSAARAIWSAASFDVHRQLLSAALSDDEFVRAPDTYEEGSVGAFIRRRSRVLFPLDEPSALQALLYESPGEFEVELQARLKVFRGV